MNQQSFTRPRSFEEYEKALGSRVALIPDKITYKTEFAKRLDYYIPLTNVYSKQYISLEKIAELIGLQSVYELRKYYLEDHDLTFVFIERVADKLGISKEWLKNGSGRMIIPKYNRSHLATNCYKEVKEDNPKKIIFCLSDESHLGVICQIDDIKFNICDYTWHFNSDVGGDGMRQIKSIYDFIYYLDKDNMLSKCEVLFFSNDLFNSFFEEYSIPPSAVLSLGKRKYLSLAWLEDFISLKSTTIYGEHFSFCQKVVRDMNTRCNQNF